MRIVRIVRGSTESHAFFSRAQPSNPEEVEAAQDAMRGRWTTLSSMQKRLAQSPPPVLLSKAIHLRMFVRRQSLSTESALIL